MIHPTTKKLIYPIIQSPMAGCTELAFRLIARRRGLAFAFAEMISAEGLVRQSRHTFDLLKTVPEDQPLGVQLVGGKPDVMSEAARMLEDRGFSVLDLNCGCPVRKITAQGGGAALLKDPKKAAVLFKAVVRAVKRMPVTVKIRKGYEDDSGREAVRIAKSAEDEGLAAITMHGRTRAQGYSGKADWGAIRMVKEAVRIPVIGNGDIFHPKDAKRMMDQTRCDGVMIGRGGLGNPWIYSSIERFLAGKPFFFPTLTEKKEVALEHLALEVQFEGEDRAARHMRRMGAWYLQGIPRASVWRNQLHRTQSLKELEIVLTKSLTEAEEDIVSKASVPA